MEPVFLAIVVFLCVLAVFDLVVGVSNDAVNFINGAIGAKVASYKVIIAVAAVGVFVGAVMSNGMMDVARHGIFSPQYFTFYEVMCIFLAVMVTDVVLLDIFNSLGMPTSTTVSLVFEMLGGAFALSVIKMASGAVGPDGIALGIGELLNTDKALSVIMAIFMSVAIAFVFGVLVMWLSRMLFTFVTPSDRSVRTILFGAVCATTIVWFLLINGLKGSTLMTPELSAYISENTLTIIAGCMVVMTLVMTVLSLFKADILKVVVLLGTFALAMAFAGNDLVNFIGVPLTGLDSYLDYTANGNGQSRQFLMTSLHESAHTPILYLMIAGTVMVLTLIFSKKAQNVVKTSVDLSRQDEGDEMFGSSGVARTLVRSTMKSTSAICKLLPAPFKKYVNSRFNSDELSLPEGAAFDKVRASVNLVLAGLLVALGTAYKLPLSTTYVTFMVAMGASLADRAWSRESAVFRITGVMSVIGGWFITAGVAFFFAFIVTSFMYFGSFTAMAASIALAIFLIISSNMKFSKKVVKQKDVLFDRIMHTTDKREIWGLLCQHISEGNAKHLSTVENAYRTDTDSLLTESYKGLKQTSYLIDEQRKELKRQRRRELLSMQRLDPLKVIPRNTWYFLGINSCSQMLYCMKRINDPIREHIGNNFSSLPEEERGTFIKLRDGVLSVYEQARKMLESGDYSNADTLRNECTVVQKQLSAARKQTIDTLQDNKVNMNTQLITILVLQESQELVGNLRHMLRGMSKFAE